MIKKLERRMLFTIMLFVTIVIAGLIAVITVVPALRDESQAETYLKELASEGVDRRDPPDDGVIPPADPAGSMPSSGANPFLIANAMVAQFDSAGTITAWRSDRTDLYNESFITQAADVVLEKKADFGTYEGLYYLKEKNSAGTLLVLMDNSVMFTAQRRTLLISCAAGAAAWLAFLGLAILLVRRMTRPVLETFNKQRRFISDAGHELNTPVSVISANANVLQSEIGANRWLDYIQNETKRMESLIRNLMTLAKTEDPENRPVFAAVDLSETVMQAALPFESLAFERGILLDLDVPPDITVQGDANQLEMLVTILMSNAVKYAAENGVIRLSLTGERKKAVLTVYNTGQGIRPEEKNAIFERFYRTDSARTREKGGYGLGLSIAGAIVQEHKGGVNVESVPDEWIAFTITLPTARDESRESKKTGSHGPAFFKSERRKNKIRRS